MLSIQRLKIAELFSPQALAVLGVGLLVRLYVVFNTALINLDGMLYIQQARAIYQGAFERVFTFDLNFLPINSVLIVPSYFLVNDWILAARCVSLFFGFFLLVPIYLTLKHFFAEKICALALLTIALTPTFVSRSADILKDPVAWFFLALGIYLFILHTERKTIAPLLMSSMAFLLAAWARNEFLLAFVTTALYIAVTSKGSRVRNTVLFLAPPLLLGVVAGILSIAWGNHGVDALQLNRITNKSLTAYGLNPLSKLANLKASIYATAVNAPPPLRFFLSDAASLAYLIAFVSLGPRWLEATVYLYGIIIIVGYLSIKSALVKDSRFSYFFLLVTVGVLLLYVQMLMHWVVEYRYFGIVIVPAAIFAGHGVQKICDYLERKTHQSQNKILLGLMCLILVLGLGKNLEPRYTDKAVYKEIGEVIAAQTESLEEVSISGVAGLAPLQWVEFYANYDKNNLKHPRKVKSFLYEEFLDQENLKGHLIENNISYILIAEKSTDFGKFAHTITPENIDSQVPDFLTKMGQWQQKDQGRLLLYHVNS